MAEIMIRTIQLRRSTKPEWMSRNPVLAAGEQGYEIDTGRLKIGDGSTRWTDLDYFTGTTTEGPISGELAAHIDSETPHPVYDDGPSLLLLYENAKV